MPTKMQKVLEDLMSILEEEGDIKQSELADTLWEDYSWEDEYESHGSIRSAVSRHISVLEAQGTVEIEDGVEPEGGGKMTRKIEYVE